ncbi:hypothetical protein Oscil6304_4055 [Oscillatoria acuminata PCC 6304]|uniref:Uncharacterized protein n=1 Tax=Oscillatoria acuminata PCC 6304 TaxID=56110 RepID=K9TN51_9CYAN|nr:hypothetical protein Oscil6304_4055 [Oscillatoria acuminata PCC 6304]
MPQSQEFIPLNPFAGIQLSRSLLNNVDFVFQPQKMTGPDLGKLGQTDIRPLKSIKLLAEISADDNSIQNQLDCPPEGSDLWAALNFRGRLPKLLKLRLGISKWVDPKPLKTLQQTGPNPEWIALVPIILNPLLKRVKAIPPHIKNFTVKTGNFALNLSRKGSRKEVQIHQDDYNSRTDKVPTGLFPKLALKNPGIYPDNLEQVPLKKQPCKSSFIAVNSCFLSKKTPIIGGRDTVELRPVFNLLTG